MGQKSVFWQALLATIIVFNLGIFLGYMMEASRVDKISEMALQSELRLLDLEMQLDLASLGGNICSVISENLAGFADKIFEESKVLDRYEAANKISSAIANEHRKYDALRAFLWVNAIRAKKQCYANFTTIVYLYQYNEPSIETKARQRVFSSVLGDVKQALGNKVILIPLAADNNIETIDILRRVYNVTSYPAVLIDEKKVVTELKTKEEFLEMIEGK